MSDHQLTLVRWAGLESAHPSGSQGPLVNLEHWDAQWYSSIALHGYTSRPDAAFYPGYPLVAAFLHAITFGAVGVPAALFVVSWGALCGVALLLVRLCRHVGVGQVVALVTLFTLLFGPGSCFLISWYPLSSYLFLTCAAFILLFEGKEWTAALVAGAATSLSPVAIAVSLALAVRFLARGGPTPLPARLAKCALSVWGVAGYGAFCLIRYGSLLEPLRAQAHWYVKAIVPFTYLPTMIYATAVDHFDRATVVALGLDLLCEALALGLIVRLVVGLSKRSVSHNISTFSLFTIASLLIPASTIVPYGTTFRAEGFARLSGASIGYDVEIVRSVRRRSLLWAFAALWFFLGLLGQILFSGGWFT